VGVVGAFVLAAGTARTEQQLVPNLGEGNGSAGPKDVPSGNASVNFYAEVASDIAAGASKITVQNTTGTGSWAAGQLILVWQVAGLPSATSGDATPIALTDQVGRYEFARVQSVADAELTLSQPLSNMSAYAAAASQVIFVPEFTNVTVAKDASIVPQQAWDGRKGGVVAFLATGTVSNDGDVNADGAGFRGGAPSPDLQQYGCTDLDMDLPNSATGQKGESPVGLLAKGGRGNVASGGGAAICWNSGAGGGGHRAVGGHGGTTWSGDGTRPMWGLGGASIQYAPETFLTFGGGGGGGQGDNSSQTAGGAGGGVVLVRAHAVSGSGRFGARGATPVPKFGGGSADGGGGGGAGGSVLIRAANLGCGSIDVRGGDGSYSERNNSGEGGGGGGAGGLAWLEARYAGTSSPDAGVDAGDDGGAPTACLIRTTGGAAGTVNGITSQAMAGGDGPSPNLLPPLGDACAGGVSSGCVSGKCNDADGLCGLLLGATCSADIECRSAACAGTCVETKPSNAVPDASTPDSGGSFDSGSSQGPIDSGASRTPSFGASDASTLQLSGGGNDSCGCRTVGWSVANRRGSFLTLAFLGLIWACRRGRRNEA
jgi:hypothetical protein